MGDLYLQIEKMKFISTNAISVYPVDRGINIYVEIVIGYRCSGRIILLISPY